MKEEHPNNPPFRRVAAKCALFLALVIAIGAVLQTILRHKWSPYVENVSTRYQALMEEPAGTIDVLYLGSSPLYAAVNPAVIWNESGVTGYNLGLSNQNAMTVYYELQYLLKHHTPQVVCIDANSIVSDRTPENEEYETHLPQGGGRHPRPGGQGGVHPRHLPHLRQPARLRLLAAAVPLPRPLERAFPQRFQPADRGHLLPVFSARAACWRPASRPRSGPASTRCRTIPSTRRTAPWSRSITTGSSGSAAENGIQVAVILPPHLGADPGPSTTPSPPSAPRTTCRCWPTPPRESWLADGFDLDTDLYEWNHLNIYGQAKFSAIVADCLQEWFGLEDHRGDPAYAAWDEAYAEYLDFFAQAEAALAEGPAEEELPARLTVQAKKEQDNMVTNVLDYLGGFRRPLAGQGSLHGPERQPDLWSAAHGRPRRGHRGGRPA